MTEKEEERFNWLALVGTLLGFWWVILAWEGIWRATSTIWSILYWVIWKILCKKVIGGFLLYIGPFGCVCLLGLICLVLMVLMDNAYEEAREKLEKRLSEAEGELKGFRRQVERQAESLTECKTKNQALIDRLIALRQELKDLKTSPEAKAAEAVASVATSLVGGPAPSE